MRKTSDIKADVRRDVIGGAWLVAIADGSTAMATAIERYRAAQKDQVHIAGMRTADQALDDLREAEDYLLAIVNPVSEQTRDVVQEVTTLDRLLRTAPNEVPDADRLVKMAKAAMAYAIARRKADKAVEPKEIREAETALAIAENALIGAQKPPAVKQEGLFA